MKRRPAKPISRPSGNPTRSSALLVIDARPIRDQARREYDQACRELATARQQLEQFREQDQPQFQRWFHASFGSVLTEIRELNERFQRNRELILRVQMEVFMTGCSYRQAYQQIMEDEANPRSASDNEDPPFQSEQNGQNQRHAGEQTDFDFESFGQNERGDIPRSRKVAPKRTVASRVKELYRALVRRLHPDTQKEMTAQKLDWWHQTQTAYQQGDENQLEVILAWCEMEDDGATTTSVSLLQRILSQLRRSIRALKRELSECRRNPAWNFSNCDKAKKHSQLKREMLRDLAALRFECAALDEQLATFQKKRASRRPEPIRRRRQGPPFAFEVF